MKTYIKINIIFWLFLFISSSHAQWSDDPQLNTAICVESGDQASPDIQPDGSGGFYITWLDKRSGTTKVWAAHLTENGENLWQVNGQSITSNYNQHIDPVILSLQQQGIIFVWEETNNIYGQRLDFNGIRKWGVDGSALSKRVEKLNKQSEPDIAAGPDDGVLVVYHETGSPNYIRAQMVTTTGDTSAWGWKGVTVSTSVGSGAASPQIVKDGKGGAFIVWLGYSNLRAQRLDQTGQTTWNGNGITVSADANPKEHPQIVNEQSARCYVVWENVRGEDRQIMVQKLNSNGSRMWSSAGKIVCNSSAQQSAATVAEDGTGGLFIAWVDQRNAVSDIYIQHINSDGAVLWDADGVALSDSSRASAAPKLSTANNGDAIVVWQEYHDIYAQRIDFSGTILWTPGGVAVSTQPDSQLAPTTIADDAGNAIVVWQDFRNKSNYDIYAQRIDKWGFLGLDNQAPSIVHNRVSTHGENTELIINAIIVDTQSGVKTATLHYRNEQQTEFSNFTLEATTADSFMASISAELVQRPYIYYYITAEDNYVNVSRLPDTGEFVTEILDRTAPNIIHQDITSATASQILEIAFTTDQGIADIRQAMLYYRIGGNVHNDSLTMTTTPGWADKLAVVIPSDAVTIRGLFYHIMAEDSAGNTSRYPQQGDIQINVSSQNLEKPEPQPAGYYQIISVPLDLDSSLPDNVLADDLGAYDIKKWRLFQWNTVDEQYTEHGNPGFSGFTPGTAKWLITKNEKTIDVGAGTSVDPNYPFVIDLQQGWNVIGHPFAFAVPWDSVTKTNVYNELFNYSEAGWDTVAMLEPWNGYLVYAEHQDARLEIPPRSATAALGKKMHATYPDVESLNWAVQIVAECYGQQDAMNYAAVSTVANVGRDRFDIIEPPNPPGDYVMLYFPHPEWDKPPFSYTTDVRPISESGIRWDFAVQTNRDNAQVTLHVNNIEQLPPDFELLLLDIQAQSSVDVKNKPDYKYLSSGKREFTLLAGPAEFLQKMGSIGKSIPTQFELQQNFPNPFNNATEIRYALPAESIVSIRVLNILGEEIRHLASRELQRAGHHLVIWDGTDDQHNIVASGIYFYQLRTDEHSFVKTRKMLFAK